MRAERAARHTEHDLGIGTTSTEIVEQDQRTVQAVPAQREHALHGREPAREALRGGHVRRRGRGGRNRCQRPGDSAPSQHPVDPHMAGDHLRGGGKRVDRGDGQQWPIRLLKAHRHDRGAAAALRHEALPFEKFEALRHRSAWRSLPIEEGGAQPLGQGDITVPDEIEKNRHACVHAERDAGGEVPGLHGVIGAPRQKRRRPVLVSRRRTCRSASRPPGSPGCQEACPR